LFFSQTNSTFYVHYFYFFGLGFATWIVYFIDQIIDYLKRKTKGDDRHHLTLKTIFFQLLLGAVLLVSMWLNKVPLLPRHFYFIVAIIAFVGLYFSLVLTKLGFFKEVFSAFIMTVSIAIFPQYLNGIIELKLEYFAYFLMLFSNLILLSIADTKHDQKLGFNSLVIYLGKNLAVKLLLIIVVGLFLSSFWCFESIQLWIMVHAILTLLLLYFNPKIESHLMHFLADFILLFPLYYLSVYL
jgi:hypothetical protein